MKRPLEHGFRKARRLHVCDKVAIISPSWGGPYLFPELYEIGLRVVKDQLDLQPVEFPTARMSPDELASHPERRAADINAAFSDRSIMGIISSIGGDDSVRILRHLDKEVTSNPKLLMGFSDFTTLLAYVAVLGNVTYHGPAIMAGIAQATALGTEYVAHLRTFLMTNPGRYDYHPYPASSHGYPDWAIRANLGKTNPPLPNAGWDWLQSAPCHTAYIWGGCIEVLEFMKGTDYWPDRSFFDDKFLLLETSEERPSPTQVLRFLRNYGTQTILNRIQGLLFGRPRGYTQEQKQQLRDAVHHVVIEEHGRTDMPILLDFDVGHTDPQCIVPFGIRAEIDSESNRVTLLESPFDEA